MFFCSNISKLPPKKRTTNVFLKSLDINTNGKPKKIISLSLKFKKITLCEIILNIILKKIKILEIKLCDL